MRQALASFELTDDNAAPVAEICYRLDGIPLALELAAACIPFLTAHQVSGRLGDALELLSRGDRATVDRQQTLAATLAWSHDLLGDDERILFRRLAVFTGTFSLGGGRGDLRRRHRRDPAAHRTCAARRHLARDRRAPRSRERAIACWRPYGSSPPNSCAPAGRASSFALRTASGT